MGMYVKYTPIQPNLDLAPHLHHSDAKLPRTAFLSKSRVSNEYIYAIIVPLFCYEGDGTEPLPTVLRRCRERLAKDEIPRVSILIGSEGGFSLSEAEYAKREGLIPVGLGKRILRTETAASFALACLVYELELSE